MGRLKQSKEFLELKEAILKNGKIGIKKVMISPTDSCNLRCKICWRLDKEKNPNSWVKQELNITQIKNILHDCKKLGVKVIDLTGGGEAFCREDIFEIIKIAKSHGFFVTLTTNGTLLTQEKIQKLIDLQVDDICFSLDSPDQEVNDYIRGEGVYNKIIDSIKIINKLKFRENSDKPTLRIATVLTKKNYKSLDQLIPFCNDYHIHRINFSVLTEWETNKEFSMKNEKYQEVLNRLRKKLDNNKISHNLNSIIQYGLFAHEIPRFCFSPWEMVFINSRGDVMACCTLASLYENVLGNVKKESLYDIWFGKNMEDFRTMIKSKVLFEECHWCVPEITERYNKLYAELK